MLILFILQIVSRARMDMQSIEEQINAFVVIIFLYDNLKKILL